MIAALRGTVSEISGNLITLDVNGVGYEVFCSSRCRRSLQQGQESSLVIHTDVKEDSIRLFGFEERLEKQIFLLLTRVKGIGARSALEIVSELDKRELLRAIGAGDVSRLQGIRGVGRKTAERIVLELRDRVADFAMEGQVERLAAEGDAPQPGNDAVEALVSLGFSRREAETAVRRAQGAAGDKADAAGLVKEALKFV